MKISVFPIFLLVALLAGGCGLFHHRTEPVQAAVPGMEAAPPIVTPDRSLAAKVVVFNADYRYVVLGFPVGRMPRQEQSLFLYRNGIKVGEVKINGSQRDNFVAADLVAGEAQVGDEVRDQ